MVVSRRIGRARMIGGVESGAFAAETSESGSLVELVHVLENKASTKFRKFQIVEVLDALLGLEQSSPPRKDQNSRAALDVWRRNGPLLFSDSLHPSFTNHSDHKTIASFASGHEQPGRR